jgi:hypothetical protein
MDLWDGPDTTRAAAGDLEVVAERMHDTKQPVGLFVVAKK